MWGFWAVVIECYLALDFFHSLGLCQAPRAVVWLQVKHAIQVLNVLRIVSNFGLEVLNVNRDLINPFKWHVWTCFGLWCISAGPELGYCWQYAVLGFMGVGVVIVDKDEAVARATSCWMWMSRRSVAKVRSFLLCFVCVWSHVGAKSMKLVPICHSGCLNLGDGVIERICCFCIILLNARDACQVNLLTSVDNYILNLIFNLSLLMTDFPFE